MSKADDLVSSKHSCGDKKGNCDSESSGVLRKHSPPLPCYLPQPQHVGAAVLSSKPDQDWQIRDPPCQRGLPVHFLKRILINQEAAFRSKTSVTFEGGVLYPTPSSLPKIWTRTKCLFLLGFFGRGQHCLFGGSKVGLSRLNTPPNQPCIL